MPVYSVFARTFEAGEVLPSDEEWIIPKLNRLYEKEVSQNRIVKYLNNGIECEYALIYAISISEKDVKRAMGFGICFPKLIGEKNTRMIMFRDLIVQEFLDMAVGHEYAHLVAKEGISEEEDEKNAFTLELKVAELAGKKQEWLKYNEREYPWRIKQMQNFGLLD